MLQEVWAKKGTTFGGNICRIGISCAFEASVKSKTFDRFVSEDTAVNPSHLVWATHDFVDLSPTVCPSSKMKNASLQFFTVQSVPMSLSILTACLPFSITSH